MVIIIHTWKALNFVPNEMDSLHLYGIQFSTAFTSGGRMSSSAHESHDLQIWNAIMQPYCASSLPLEYVTRSVTDWLKVLIEVNRQFRKHKWKSNYRPNFCRPLGTTVWSLYPKTLNFLPNEMDSLRFN